MRNSDVIRKTVLTMSVMAALVVCAIGIVGYSRTLRWHIESAGRPKLQNRSPDDESAWLVLRSEHGRFVFDYYFEHRNRVFNLLPNYPSLEQFRSLVNAIPDVAEESRISTWWPQVPGVSAFRYRRSGIEVVRSRALVPDEWIHLSIPFWQPTAALFAYPIFLLATRPIRHRWRRRKGVCVRCGYNLTGNISGVCPECGSTI